MFAAEIVTTGGAVARIAAVIGGMFSVCVLWVLITRRK